MGFSGQSSIPAITGAGSTPLTGASSIPAIIGVGRVGIHSASVIPAIEGHGSASGQVIMGESAIPAIVGRGLALAGTLARGSSKIPSIKGHGLAYSGNIGSGASVIPAIKGTGLIRPNLHFSGASILPMITGRGLAYPTGIIRGSSIIPAIAGSGYARSTSISRRGIVMNLRTGVVTHYENFNFDSLAQVGDQFIGANENGLFLLGGETDLGDKIPCFIESGEYDLSWKLPREAWLAYEPEGGDATFHLTMDEGETYEYPFEPEEQTDEGVAVIGKGIVGRFMHFGIKNVSGSPLVINLIRIFGDIIKRRGR